MKINKWDLGDQVSLFISNDSIEDTKEKYEDRIGNKCWIDTDGGLTFEIGVELKKFTLIRNENEDINVGDIIAVSENGNISFLYSNDENEIDLFMTNQCNSNCVMCPLSEYVRKEKKKNQQKWLEAYIDLLPCDVGYINITGGEPTLYQDSFLAIMKKVTEKFDRTDYQLLTNGRSLADRRFLEKVLEVIPRGIRFAIPLHSSDEFIHDGITQSKGSFRQTDRGIKNLLQSMQKVEIRIVLSKKNIDTVIETAEYIISNYSGVFCVNFIGMEMMGNAAVNREELWLDYEDVFIKAKPAIDKLVEAGIDVQLYNFPLCAVDRGYWPIAAKSITDYKIRFMDECDGCSVKEICGGFFFSTKQVMQPKVKPIGRTNEK